MKTFALLIGIFFCGVTQADSFRCIKDDFEIEVSEQPVGPGDQLLGGFTASKLVKDKPKEVLFTIPSDPVLINRKTKLVSLLTGSLASFHVNLQDALNATKPVDLFKVPTKREFLGREVKSIHSIDFAFKRGLVDAVDGKTYEASLHFVTFQQTGSGNYFSAAEDIECKFKQETHE